jgi:hypothetical protein
MAARRLFLSVVHKNIFLSATVEIVSNIAQKLIINILDYHCSIMTVIGNRIIEHFRTRNYR